MAATRGKLTVEIDPDLRSVICSAELAGVTRGSQKLRNKSLHLAI
jgi:hypothetical protein